MTIISKKVTICSSFWKKGTGLMFTQETSDFAYVFPFKKAKRIMITMWFVFYPIDILFLRDGVVVEIAEFVKPFTHYRSSKKADTFIEVPPLSTKPSYLGKKVTWNDGIVEIVEIADK